MYKITIKGRIYQVTAQVLRAIRARGVRVEFVIPFDRALLKGE